VPPLGARPPTWTAGCSLGRHRPSSQQSLDARPPTFSGGRRLVALRLAGLAPSFERKQRLEIEEGVLSFSPRSALRVGPLRLIRPGVAGLLPGVVDAAHSSFDGSMEPLVLTFNAETQTDVLASLSDRGMLGS
jgi:hypothetical protein